MVRKEGSAYAYSAIWRYSKSRFAVRAGNVPRQEEAERRRGRRRRYVIMIRLAPPPMARIKEGVVV